jgi:hypothetical protein
VWDRDAAGGVVVRHVRDWAIGVELNSGSDCPRTSDQGLNLSLGGVPVIFLAPTGGGDVGSKRERRVEPADLLKSGPLKQAIGSPFVADQDSAWYSDFKRLARFDVKGEDVVDRRSARRQGAHRLAGLRP